MKKIGIIRIDRMGDMILTLPIIKALKIKYPNSAIHIFSSNKNYKILKNFKYVDKIINTDLNLKRNKEKYNYIFNFSPGWKSFFLCLLLKSNNKANIILTSRYKHKIYSKKLLFTLSKFFFEKTLFINRIENFKKNKPIHQTIIMFELLKKCKIILNKKINLEKFLPHYLLLKPKKNICLIHLSSKWINKYYNETDFVNLVSNLKEKFNLVLTTDETTSQKFKKIYNIYPIIKNNEFNDSIKLNNPTIFENLQFENWIQAIYSSKIIITPECGCSHIAAICKVPSKIIYDSSNQPEMIYAEYAPWESKHEKFFFNDKNLNFLLLNNL